MRVRRFGGARSRTSSFVRGSAALQLMADLLLTSLWYHLTINLTRHF
ncbi:MAG: hypothetical protein KatS3mg057_2748 [Herpetosiphonaceae bacterium]|nr:MAG: hypothetical protein KatS3mg057_2748 [Herpetosiphonaceae bacterium]